MKIVEFSVRNPMVGHLLTAICLIGGIIAMLSLKREVFPETSLDLVVITAPFPNASPEEVEDLVTVPIEEEIRELEGIEEYFSSSLEGLSYIVVQLDTDYPNTDRTITDIQRKVDRVKLPSGAEEPDVNDITTEQPVLRICVTGGKDERDLRRYTDLLESRMLQMSDVSTVAKTGWRDEEFWVEVNPERLRELDLSITEVVTSLGRRNVNLPGGKLPGAGDGGELVLRTVGKFHTPEEIAEVIVRSNIDGQSVQVKDLGTVQRTYEPDAVFARSEGRPTIILAAKKKRNADVIDLADKLIQLVEEEREMADGVFDLTIIDDQSYYVKRRLSVVSNNGLVGIGLVLAVLLLFLNWRIAIFTGFGMPFSILAAFILMLYFGLTINLMTLFGMIIVLGMIVDDAIIVGENMYRHIEEGMEPRQAAITGAQEVAWPVFTTVATTIAAFMPLFFAPDIYAKYLGWLVVLVVVTLTASLFECLFLMPAHVAEFGRPVKTNQKKNIGRAVGDGLMGAGAWLYSHTIRTCLKLRYVVLLIVFVVFGYMLVHILKFVKIDPFPGDLIDVVSVSVNAPVGSSLETTEEVVARVEQRIAALSERELDTYVSYIGIQRSIDGSVQNQGTRYGQAMIYFTPQDSRPDRLTVNIVNELREACAQVEGADQIEFQLVKPGPPVGRPVEVKIKGRDFGELQVGADEVKAWLAEREGVYDVQDDFVDGKDEVHVVLNEKEAARLGLSMEAVAGTVYAAFQGAEATVVREGKEELKVRVRLQEPWRSDLASVSQLMIPNQRGRMIDLKHVASLEKRKGLPGIDHYNGDRVITVSANINDKLTTGMEVNGELAGAFRDFSQRHQGMDLLQTGEYEENQKLISFMKKAFIMAVLVIYSILALQFNSFFQPFILLITIPLGLIGVILALMLYDKPVSIMAMMGMVGLAGVVVNDAIVLVSFINNARKRGASVIDALVDAGEKRLRPILLTTVTTVAGLMPVIYGFGGYEPFLVPAAITLAYGLLFASFFTLIVVPCVYYVFSDIGRFTAWLTRRGVATDHVSLPAGGDLTRDDSEKVTYVKDAD